MNKIKYISIFLMSLFSTVALAYNNGKVAEAQLLVQRLLPAYSQNFQFAECQSSHGKDCFSIESRDGKILIKGNNPVSMAMGLNHYLRKYCNVTVSWYEGTKLILPDTLPTIPSTERVEARVNKRFFLNYCTYGYTMPFWQWKQWEHFIDWMALNGVNMPLAITGQEAVWYNIWKKLGLTDSEIRGYFTGPAYLPWHRMGNIDGWNGPLPMEWIENQVDLQKQILERERSLSMTPVLPAFAGHVPVALKQIYPNADIKKLSAWAGFKQEYNCYFLNPEESLFAKIQKLYLTEQTRLFGTDHVYGIDPFNELEPPSWEPNYLHKVANKIYRSLSSFDSKAIWLQMTWMFYFQRKDWTQPRVEAMLTGVPKGKLLLLDYHCENVEIWKNTNKFYGDDYIWCYLGNFGGNTTVTGDVKESGIRVENALKVGGSNMVGIGSTLEGLDVMQFPYEYIFEKAWNYNVGDSAWVQSLADRHCGFPCKSVREAWQILFNDVYTQVPRSMGIAPCYRPEMDKKPKGCIITYRAEDLEKAWRLLLNVPQVSTDAMTIDLIVLGRQVMGNMFQDIKEEFDRAYHEKNVMALSRCATQMSEILRDIDALNAFHPYCSLDTWLKQARQMGNTPELKNFYEKNARSIITVWGSRLNDYASRSWSGLTANYYSPRWLMYIDMVMNAVASGKEFSQDEYNKKVSNFEDAWINSHADISEEKGYDILQFSKMLYRKYITQRHE